MADASDLPARLRAARTAAGLSQGQAARLMGLHRPTISEIEAGRRAVRAEELTTFADLYGVSLEGLAGRGDETPPHVILAARKMSKLEPADLVRVLELIDTLSGADGG